MGLEATITAGVNTAFAAAGDQRRAITLTPSPSPALVYNSQTDDYTGTPAAAFALTAIRYEDAIRIDGVEVETNSYLVKSSDIVAAGYTQAAVSQTWTLFDVHQSDSVARHIISIDKPHTAITILHCSKG